MILLWASQGSVTAFYRDPKGTTIFDNLPHLLVVSREEGNMIPINHLYDMLPYSLLRASKYGGLSKRAAREGRGGGVLVDPSDVRRLQKGYKGPYYKPHCVDVEQFPQN